jgi:tetratricopeptide (TPR) repeat protein
MPPPLKALASRVRLPLRVFPFAEAFGTRTSNAVIRIGDVQREQGDLAAALTSYQASLAISERLAQADPGNARWQRDLSLSYDRVAAVEMRQGARDDADNDFQQGRDIITQLIRRSPDDATLLRDLAWFGRQIATHDK